MNSGEIALARMWPTGRWRREWDSNPRNGFPFTRFPSVRLKPLGHPSRDQAGGRAGGQIDNSFRPPTFQARREGSEPGTLAQGLRLLWRWQLLDPRAPHWEVGGM